MSKWFDYKHLGELRFRGWVQDELLVSLKSNKKFPQRKWPKCSQYMIEMAREVVYCGP